MWKRRQLLSSSLLGFTTAAAAGQAGATPRKKDPMLIPPAVSGARMNLQQAQQVMADANIGALLLSQGGNFRWATGHQPVVSKMGFPAANAALVAAGEPPAVAALMAAFSYYYLASDMALGQQLPVLVYGADGQQHSAEALLEQLRFADRGDVPLSAREKQRLESTAAVLAATPPAATMPAGLRRLLRQHGLEQATVAVDDPAIAAMVKEAAPGVTVIPADDALRRIRPVKSAREIALMRTASQINIDAAHACLPAALAGASYRELRQTFFAEAARRGARGVFMVIDHTSDEQYEARFSAGQAFLIDCVSEYEGYHGDYGRTVFLDEPTRTMARATRAVGRAWDQLRQELRPGLRFSEIRELGSRAMAQANGRYRVPFQPHSVGLLHTDHLGDGSSGPREDVVLVPGMIISVDCPLMESGIGGSVHLEDLMLITDDGAEPIHDVGQQTILVSA